MALFWRFYWGNNMHRDIEKLSKKPREFWERIIDQWVFDEKARYALKRNFLDFAPYEQIAEELDVSRATVYNKIAKYEKQIFKNCD